MKRAMGLRKIQKVTKTRNRYAYITKFKDGVTSPISYPETNSLILVLLADELKTKTKRENLYMRKDVLHGEKNNVGCLKAEDTPLCKNET